MPDVPMLLCRGGASGCPRRVAHCRCLVGIHHALFLALLLVMLSVLASWSAEHDEFARPEQDELSEMFHGLVEDYDEVEHELTTDY